MASNEYHFTHHWHIPHATLTEVADIIEDAPALPQWWPATYLDVQTQKPADADGLSGVYEVYTKGWLPYTLRWTLATTARNYPHGLSIKAAGGDFQGTGLWVFVAEGPHVKVTFDWRIVALKPLLRYLSFAFKPLFRFNHNWCMRQGAKSLQLEIMRRRALAQGHTPNVAPPPGPTFRWLING